MRILFVWKGLGLRHWSFRAASESLAVLFCFFLYVFHGIRSMWQFLLEYSRIYSNVCYRWHMLDWISRVTALWDVLSQLHYLWDIPCWREAALLLFPPTMRSTFQRNKCMTNSRLTTSSSRLLSALLMNKEVLATVSFTLFHMYGEATKGYRFAIMINILVTCMWVCLCLSAFWFNCILYFHILVFQCSVTVQYRCWRHEYFQEKMYTSCIYYRILNFFL